MSSSPDRPLNRGLSAGRKESVLDRLALTVDRATVKAQAVPKSILAFTDAVDSGDVDAVRLAFEAIDPEDRPNAVNSVFRKGLAQVPFTCLGAAVWNAETDYSDPKAPKTDDSVFEWLLDQGAAVNQPDPNGRTALYLACEKERLGMIFRLLSEGADSGILTDTHRTAIIAFRDRGLHIKYPELMERLNDAAGCSHPEPSKPPVPGTILSPLKTFTTSVVRDGQDLGAASRRNKTERKEAEEEDNSSIFACWSRTCFGW